MTFEEDFYQTFRDFLEIEQRRHSNIMALLTDVTAKITAMNAAIDAKAAAHESALSALKVSVDKALADLTDTGAAGHAAVLDTIVAGMGDTMTKLDSLDMASKLSVMTTEITAAITAVPVPKVS
jgi:hypothetical protein